MPEPLDPQRFHIMPTTMVKKLTLFAFFCVVVVFPIFALNYYKLAVNRPSPLDREMTFEINSGEGISEISKKLYEEGAINSEFLFSFYVFVNKLDRNIQAGSYTLTAGSSVVELAELFQHGVNDYKITFLEGWRAEEIARAAAKQFNKIDYSEFARKATEFEGYLFPDTYYFETGTREDDMIAKLRDTFDKKTADLFTATNLSKVGLSKEQVVIFASIVEREVNDPEDRKLVAGILINRFKEGISLGADATTQYAIAQSYSCSKENLAAGTCAITLAEVDKFNWCRNDLTVADLEMDSLFNTRKHSGLPPRPISNPGLSAIEAVLYYQDSDYVYYLTDPSGKTHYAKTLDEHNANVIQYLQ